MKSELRQENFTKFVYAPIAPVLPDLLKVLRDETIFWEAFSENGIDERVRNADTNFMFDLMEALEGQDNAKLGAVVAAHMLGHAERIYELRQ